ncbi:neurogenic locus notch homolog protein 2-like [Littorina saxatilis]|uniref:neurogenic locus notch homolog protein 2-like n=1 Tax=Littorina saxatilis TaxID=31220 RepID=UPI0038B4716A
MTRSMLCVLLLCILTLDATTARSALKKAGEACSVDTECLDNMHCADTAGQVKTCVCDTNFAATSSNTCGRAQGLWCWYTHECADRMTCSLHACECKSGLLVRQDGSCGSKEAVSCSKTSDCGDHMTCNTTCTCDDMYEVTSLSTCETPCSDSSECEPGGRCFLTGNPPTRTCICYSGYSGTNCQTPTLTYKISVTTGSSDHAGTYARVGVVISGTSRTTERLKLSETTWTSYFVSGRTTTFNRDAVDVGEIKNITVSHYDIAGDDRWFLDRVDIVKSTNEYYTFIFESWLYRDTFHTLQDPCVTSLSQNVMSCTHVGLTSFEYNCTLGTGGSFPSCTAGTIGD